MTLEELSEVAHFSPYHFHRLFSAFVGETLAGYVRRLRLERAAHRLLHSATSITEIALSSGYETPAAFSRAFSAAFDVTPTEYRQRQHPRGLTRSERVPAAPQDIPMTPEIRITEPMSVVFVRRTGPYQQAAAEAFRALYQYAAPRGWVTPGAKMIGLTHDDPAVTDADKLRYDACLTISQDIPAQGEVGRRTIAGGRYAVFVHSGSYDYLSRSYDQIFKDWLPQSQEQLRADPCFELYLNTPMDTAVDALRTEIWLPLLPR